MNQPTKKGIKRLADRADPRSTVDMTNRAQLLTPLRAQRCDNGHEWKRPGNLKEVAHIILENRWSERPPVFSMFHFRVDPNFNTSRERIPEDGSVPQRSRSDLGSPLDPPYDSPRCKPTCGEFSRVAA